MPIHPLSYRKKWQHDDTAYNFIHDFLYALTEYNFNYDLKQVLLETRGHIANNYSIEQLYYYATVTGVPSVKNRNKTPELKKRFSERMDSWKK